VIERELHSLAVMSLGSRPFGQIMLGALPAFAGGPPPPWVSKPMMRVVLSPRGRRIRCPAPVRLTGIFAARIDRRLAQRRNGLLTRSRAIVLPGPWPQVKATSSPSGSSLSFIDAISWAWSPPGRSVRPIEP
jgi:hypothetical protein